MKKVFHILTVVAVVLAGVLLVVLLSANSKMNKKIERQKKAIDMYEETYLGTDSMSTKLSELESQLEDANSIVAELEQKISGMSEDETYLNIAFPTDGNYYKEAYDEVKFYADPTCTIEIKNVRFMSATQKSEQAKNGLEIYCLRMDNGKICYCTQSPYLITEQKYIEMQQDEE